MRASNMYGVAITKACMVVSGRSKSKAASHLPSNLMSNASLGHFRFHAVQVLTMDDEMEITSSMRNERYGRRLTGDTPPTQCILNSPSLAPGFNSFEAYRCFLAPEIQMRQQWSSTGRCLGARGGASKRQELYCSHGGDTPQSQTKHGTTIQRNTEQLKTRHNN